MHLRVTLTATDNVFLAPHLPITGLLEVGETNAYGGIVWAVFRADGLNGMGFPNPPVEVKNPEFTYAKPDYAALAQGTGHVARKALV